MTTRKRWRREGKEKDTRWKKQTEAGMAQSCRHKTVKKTQKTQEDCQNNPLIKETSCNSIIIIICQVMPRSYKVITHGNRMGSCVFIYNLQPFIISSISLSFFCSICQQSSLKLVIDPCWWSTPPLSYPRYQLLRQIDGNNDCLKSHNNVDGINTKQHNNIDGINIKQHYNIDGNNDCLKQHGSHVGTNNGKTRCTLHWPVAGSDDQTEKKTRTRSAFCEQWEKQRGWSKNLVCENTVHYVCALAHRTADNATPCAMCVHWRYGTD